LLRISMNLFTIGLNDSLTSGGNVPHNPTLYRFVGSEFFHGYWGRAIAAPIFLNMQTLSKFNNLVCNEAVQGFRFIWTSLTAALTIVIHNLSSNLYRCPILIFQQSGLNLTFQVCQESWIRDTCTIHQFD